MGKRSHRVYIFLAIQWWDRDGAVGLAAARDNVGRLVRCAAGHAVPVWALW